MSNNQKDNRNQQSDRKAQEPGGKKKRELDPNNPTAKQNDQQRSNAPRAESGSHISDNEGTTSELN
jgi:hypothetical protein